MIDENAFGILLSWFCIEDDEYGRERSDFVQRVQEFRTLVRRAVTEIPLGTGLRVLDLGHAVYVEVGDGDQARSPIAWAKEARALLVEQGFDVFSVVTHGGRWTDDTESASSVEHLGDAALVTASLPSEPLRRALHAEAASHASDEDAEDGWGPGLYLDVEAVEALAIKLRNAPTSLRTGGAEFYRIGA
ncbi:MAG TPA: hypothetical protein VHC69_14875 [Polyangiaceae bacterium]|nr:hypothetical protein [Polyangiaceae bacterium]